MRIIKVTDYDEVSVRTANMILGQVNLKPDAVLGLATGGSPVGAYKKIVEAYNNNEIDFSEVTTINLDEYRGIKRSHEQSYWSFMHENLFDHINIPKERIHFLDGNAADLDAECKQYEESIRAAGGIDIQLLGIGSNGHIAFNEPSDSFQRWTHVVSLKESTIQDNSRFFNTIEEVPTQALTMGIGSIMQAKRILIIALGEHKAKAIKQVISGNVTPECPASVLQFHTDVTLMLDRGAASLL